MHNEAIYVADTSDERLLSKIRTYVSVFGWNWNRNVLDVALQHVVASQDEQRQSVRSSGEYAVPLLARGTVQSGHMSDVARYVLWLVK